VKPLSNLGLFELDRFFDLCLGSAIVGCQFRNRSPTSVATEQECSGDSGIYEHGHSKGDVWIDHNETRRINRRFQVLLSSKWKQSVRDTLFVTINPL